jgi:hypothetical protein
MREGGYTLEKLPSSVEVVDLSGRSHTVESHFMVAGADPSSIGTVAVRAGRTRATSAASCLLSMETDEPGAIRATPAPDPSHKGPS